MQNVRMLPYRQFFIILAYQTVKNTKTSRRISYVVSCDTMSRNCMYLKVFLDHMNTWCIPTSTLRGRAAVALMTGCEASRTMYQNGFEWQQENPPGSSIRFKG